MHEYENVMLPHFYNYVKLHDEHPIQAVERSALCASDVTQF